MLITGRHDPIVGADLIDASLARLHGAVDHVHRATLDGINAGTDVLTLMREIDLPTELRVGQGYGKVPWAVRTFWESYVGWFRLQSSTELYPVDPREATAELAGLLGRRGRRRAGPGQAGRRRARARPPAGRGRCPTTRAPGRWPRTPSRPCSTRATPTTSGPAGWLRDRIAGLEA